MFINMPIKFNDISIIPNITLFDILIVDGQFLIFIFDTVRYHTILYSILYSSPLKFVNTYTYGI